MYALSHVWVPWTATACRRASHLLYIAERSYTSDIWGIYGVDNVVAADAFSCTANNFTFMYSQKRFRQQSLLISTTYFQNRIIMFCLELWYSAENKMQSFGCQQREQHVFKWNYEITVVQEIHISRLELQILTLEFVIHFLKNIFGIWDRGLASSFSDHVIQISVRQTHFQFIFSKLRKGKVLCRNL